MKKIKVMAFLLALAVVMSGCCISHDWEEADCVTPKTCAKCEKTEGEALGHDWAEADCVNPKTCDRCGETEGEALGHDWAEADCLNPKTCGRCALTEGEALGHSYSGWEVSGADTMVSTCAACGDSQEQSIDRELIGRQQILGKWELVSVTISGMWFDYAPDWTLEFREDGTFDFQSMELETGEYVYVEFYDGENMDFYVFDGNTQTHSLSLNYDPAGDFLFIIGSEYFKFERVVE